MKRGPTPETPIAVVIEIQKRAYDKKDAIPELEAKVAAAEEALGRAKSDLEYRRGELWQMVKWLNDVEAGDTDNFEVYGIPRAEFEGEVFE